MKKKIRTKSLNEAEKIEQASLAHKINFKWFMQFFLSSYTQHSEILRFKIPDFLEFSSEFGNKVLMISE